MNRKLALVFGGSRGIGAAGVEALVANGFNVAYTYVSGAAPAKLPDHVRAYRLGNHAVSSNHRYTTDPSTRRSMMAAGWIPEGYGVTGVAMCGPAP